MTQIKKPSELTAQTLLKVLIYGQPGIGKTTTALSFPDPLIIDCDRGVHRVQPQHLSDTVEVNSWDDIDEVLSDAESLTAYKTIIFDTGGKLIDFMTDYLIKKNSKFAQNDGTFSLKGYGARKAMFNNLLSRLHTMQPGKHIVFVAHEKEERDGDNRYIRPEIGGSSGNDLVKELDLVCYIEAIGKKRTAHFNPQEKFYAKNSCNLPEAMTLPDVTNGASNDFMSGIVEKYNSSLADRAKMAKEYNSLMNVVSETIDSIQDVESLNKALSTVKEINHVWDSKFRAGKLLNDEAKRLNVQYDKKTEAYK